MSTTTLAIVGASSMSGGSFLYWLGIRKPVMLPEEEGRFRIRDESKIQTGSEVHIYVEKYEDGHWKQLQYFRSLLMSSRSNEIKKAKAFLKEYILTGFVREPNVIFDSAHDPLKMLK